MNFISCTLITADLLEKYAAVSELIQGVQRLVFYGTILTFFAYFLFIPVWTEKYYAIKAVLSNLVHVVSF